MAQSHTIKRRSTPGFGRMASPQPLHGSKNWPALVGIISTVTLPQFQQVIAD